MKRCLVLILFALGLWAPSAAMSATIVGDLNNFDTINDTGRTCHGFEIELDDVVSTDITYTFDWNHYGAPKIYEVPIDSVRKRVVIRYESKKDTSGAWGANGSFTNPAVTSLSPPSGHTCTNVSVNEGCEHFGVGYYGTPTAIRYNWLVDDNAGGLVRHGTPVGVAAPKFTLAAVVGAPAQVVAAIPAPAAPIAANKKFGEPFWVKVIKTKTHNANPVRLGDLISDDTDGDSLPDWTNGEPDEVETEWKLLQTNNGANLAKEELLGQADEIADTNEQVTRRYEFYRYGAAADTIDGETGEAMCDEADPTTDPNSPAYLHGKASMTNVGVTDANGNTQYVNCATQIVIGTYIGAQMAGFAAAAPLGLIDNLQDGERGVPYLARTVIVGGDSPFTITFSGGSLPGGMSIDPASGVLSGMPASGGNFAFTLAVTDAANATAQRNYVLRVAGLPAEAYAVTYDGNGSTGGAVPVDGNVYATGATVTVLGNTGNLARVGYAFAGWNTQSGGGGTSYSAGNQFSMGAGNVKLFAKWVPLPTLQFGAASYTVGEAGSSITIPVSRIGSTTGSSTVAYATANGTATAGSDYTVASGTLTFAAGVTTQNIVVAINNDTIAEADETFTLTLSNPVGATLGVPATTTVTILDDDGGVALVNGTAVGSLAGAKGSTTYFKIDVPAGMGSLKVTTSGGSGNVDLYVQLSALPTTTTYACRSITTTNADSCTLTNPAAGRYYVMLRGTSAYSGVSLLATYAPLPPPTVQFGSASYSIGESAGNIGIPVTRSGSTAGTSTVNFATTNGTATSGSDYTSASGTLTFAPGETSKTITVPILGDTAVETNETFTLTLSNPGGGATLGTPSTTTVTILDDDAPATVQFSASAVSVNDNVGTVTVTVTRSGGTAAAASVAYGTANGTAIAGTDYTAASGNLSWGAGEATPKTFTVSIKRRSGTQPARSFTVNLSGPAAGVSLGTPATETVTILN